MENQENEHPADGLLEEAADALESAQTAQEKLETLKFLAAGDVEGMFERAIDATPELGVKATLFKVLRDANDAGAAELVMDIMETLARMSMLMDPSSLDKLKEQFRQNYDQDYS